MSVQSFYARNVVIIICTFCGLVAGIAEMIWIYVYSMYHPISFPQVGQEITRSIFGSSIANWSMVAELGLFIHILLSAFIGVVFGVIILNIIRYKYLVYLISISMLMLIWLFNYNMLLPTLNPEFISLIPSTIAMYSKFGFGIVMAMLFQYFCNNQHLEK